MQKGGTFPVYLLYKEDDVNTELGEGLNIIIAFYNYNGERVLTIRTDNGTLLLTEDGYYMCVVQHEESMSMLGNTYIEITITDDSQSPKSVYHGDEIPVLNFDERRNNEIL